MVIFVGLRCGMCDVRSRGERCDLSESEFTLSEVERFQDCKNLEFEKTRWVDSRGADDWFYGVDRRVDGNMV